MKKNNIYFIIVCNILITIVIAFIVCYYFSEKTTPQVYYVDTIKLHDRFHMTKDLTKINNQKLSRKKKKLDSLYTLYNIFLKQNNKDKINKFKEMLNISNQELIGFSKMLSFDTNQKVWKRLNQYIELYGLQNNYKIILGSEGKKNVLYADIGIDITDDFLEYANMKYEGKEIKN